MLGRVINDVITILSAAVFVVAAAPPPSKPTQPLTSSPLEIFMPNVQPTEPDTYLCTAVKVEGAHQYLTGFDPEANSHDAHHMLLYGCQEPGMQPGTVWNCGEMLSSSSAPTAGVCKSGQGILYGWAMDAPKLKLPPDVGFNIGQETPVKYLVLQVHYKNVSKFIPPANGRDSSGLIIQRSATRTPKEAGVYLMVTGGFIPAHSIEYFETACDFEEEKEIVPFAYRTHAHSLGRVISGYRVRNGEWTELGRKDPRLPEMFYNVTTPGVTIKKGDILAARCTMENTKDHTVEIGATQKDEMCNFYIMFYTEKPPLPSGRSCGSSGPPYWSWKNFEDQSKLNLKNVPETASVIPGSNKPLIKTTDSMGISSEPYYVEEGMQNQGRMTDNLVNPIKADLYQEPSLEELLEEAIDYMDEPELLYLIEQLSAEDEQAEERRRLRMRMMAQRRRKRSMMFSK